MIVLKAMRNAHRVRFLVAPSLNERVDVYVKPRPSKKVGSEVKIGVEKWRKHGIMNSNSTSQGTAKLTYRV